MKLSIILPCYNVEKYIAECLDSVYAQDIPETGWFIDSGDYIEKNLHDSFTIDTKELDKHIVK